MENYINIQCPNCNLEIIIYKNEINCGIFRHGVLKSTGEQICPHLSKINCENLITNNLIYGCGKPFRIIKNNENYKALICEYI